LQCRHCSNQEDIQRRLKRESHDDEHWQGGYGIFSIPDLDPWQRLACCVIRHARNDSEGRAWLAQGQRDEDFELWVGIMLRGNQELMDEVEHLLLSEGGDYATAI
jgi:hypothetical protein